MTKLPILTFCMYGHIETKPGAVAAGAKGVAGTNVHVRRVPELLSDEQAKKAGAKLNQATAVARVASPRLGCPGTGG